MIYQSWMVCAVFMEVALLKQVKGYLYSSV